MLQGPSEICGLKVKYKDWVDASMFFEVESMDIAAAILVPCELI